MKKNLIVVILLITLFSTSGFTQYYKTSKGDPFARKKNVHSGNQVRTTFFNYGLIGRENAAEDFGGEWPINSGHFYVGDISIMVGAQIQINGTTINPVTVADGPRGSNETDPNDVNIFWGWEPLAGFQSSDTNIVAMSHQPKSWPATWPDRENDVTDQGWPGQWNGFFGKDQFNADQESYWVMDDSRDQEFIRNNGFYPDSTDTTRGGLGLLANVRGLQWSQTLAQNTIFWLYDVTNISKTNYDKTVFGMLVGTTIGGDGDTNDDNSSFDALENMTYSWDFDNVGGTGWSPVDWMGYAFLESPGNGVNGFDDDNDAAEFIGGSIIDENMLLQQIVSVGQQVIMIDYSDPAFPRSRVNFTSNGIFYIVNGDTFVVNPGDTLKEKPYNNIDDNLNGLIDENIEIPGDGIDNNNNSLIDEENPHIGLKYLNYLTGDISNPMIDEARSDGIDNDDDWDQNKDDVGLDGKPGTNDDGEGDGFPTSGYQPLGPGGELIDTGLPGEPNIDKTDIDESDQIGLTSFFFFEPFNFVRLFRDDQLWNTLRPGFFNDGVQNVDGDFLYGTAYFPLRVGQTERISLAFFFAQGNPQNNQSAALAELIRTKNTVQLIYNNDYNFAKAPFLPTVKAFSGDNKVSLYWDTKAEESFDKLSDEVTGDGFDFEGYKIYRATYPSWDETGTVTNVFGSRVADVPMAQFDIVDSDSGYFPVLDPQTGSVFYMGDNTGLKHTYIDTTVKNGFTYFYAVTAYDRGISFTDPQTGEEKILQPAETSKFAAITQGGKTELGSNVVVVRPEAPVAGYVAPGDIMESLVHYTGDGTGRIVGEVIDPNRMKDNHEYEITFDDEDFFATTTSFSIFDITNGARDTIVYQNTNINIDAFVFDGLKLHIFNDRITGGDIRNVAWNDTTQDILMPVSWERMASGFAQGTAYPAHYQLEIGTLGIDSSAGIYVFGLPASSKFATNFRIKNISEGHYIKYNLYDIEPGENGVLNQKDIIALFELDSITPKLTYSIMMEAADTVRIPAIGDTLLLPVRKPFLSYDTFRLTSEGAIEDKSLAKSQLDEIKVVPNPYIAVASWEPRNPYSSGRGERSIHFINLPQKCTIRIFNVRGELVDTIEHNSSLTNGTADWDLLSRDQLDVAYGIYIFHVDAQGIGEKIGKFAVIK